MSAGPGAGQARPPAEEGWERRTTLSPDRVYEHVLLYNELGYEVRVESAEAGDNPDGCAACARPESPDRVLYIRRSR